MDGRSLRDHLQSAYRQTGVMPDALANAPSLPPGCAGVWGDFLALHRTRSAGIGPSRISFAEIVSYQQVRGFPFQPWEIDAIRSADAAYFEHKAEASE